MSDYYEREEAIFIDYKEHLGHKFNFKKSDPELKFYFFHVLKALWFWKFENFAILLPAYVQQKLDRRK